MGALSPRQMFLLDLACQPLRQAFPDLGPYLVGTVNDYQKGDPAPRDVDVRFILLDEAFEQIVTGVGISGLRFMNLAIGQYLASLTGLPIDFQFQKQSVASEKHDGSRNLPNPLGNRWNPNREALAFMGDAEPFDLWGNRIDETEEPRTGDGGDQS